MCRFEGEIKSSLICLSTYLAKKEKSLQLQGNHEYKIKDSLNSVQSSLKSHPLLVTL